MGQMFSFAFPVCSHMPCDVLSSASASASVRCVTVSAQCPCHTRPDSTVHGCHFYNDWWIKQKECASRRTRVLFSLKKFGKNVYCIIFIYI